MTGVPIGRILGFEIRVHVSWVIVLALVAVLVVNQLEQMAADLSAPTRWVIAAIVAAAFLASVLVHELGHAVVARRRGLETGPVVLFLFGGSVSLGLEARRAEDELAIAISGPIVSLGLGAALALLGAVAQESADTALRATGAVAIVLGVLNLLLGGVNLVPGYPLDGGRLVRALVWARTRDERRGARAAAATGRAVGWALLGAGVTVILLGDPVNGLMLGLSGWFLSSSARAVVRRAAVEDLLREVTVGDVMERDVPTISPQLTLDTFAEQLFEEDGSTTVPVVRDDAVIGVIGQPQLRRIRRGAWATTRAEQLMIGPPEAEPLGPGESAWSALDRLRRTGLDGLPVVDETGLLGVLTRRAVVRAIQSRAEVRGVPLP